MRFRLLASCLALFGGVTLSPAGAQSQMFMVPTCGSPPAGWRVGGFYPPTMSPSGALCTFPNAGSTGVDFSANRPLVPNVGANFAGAAPYANYVLVASVPAQPTRNSIDVENTSGAQIAIVLDDGTVASGAAPVNASVFSLAGGPGAGAQGGSWVSLTEKGRVRVYAPSPTAQVMVRVN